MVQFYKIFENTTGVQYEYLTIRYDIKGRGITGEFDFLDVNGERVIDRGGDGDTHFWGDRESALFEKLGKAGWMLVNHSEGGAEEIFHFATFMRQLQYDESDSQPPVKYDE